MRYWQAGKCTSSAVTLRRKEAPGGALGSALQTRSSIERLLAGRVLKAPLPTLLARVHGLQRRMRGATGGPPWPRAAGPQGGAPTRRAHANVVLSSRRATT